MGPAFGPWQLRFIIDREPDILPLSFLINHGLNEVVTVDARESGEELKWFALPAGKEDWYIITPEPASECPPGLARKEDSDIVILSEKPDEWRLQYVPINLAGGQVYEIHSRELIGAELLLGKEKKNDEAKIEAFVVGYDGPKPAWQFQPFRPE